MASRSFSLHEAECLNPSQWETAPAKSNPNPSPQRVSTWEKIRFRSRKKRAALTRGTRMMWEYCSCSEVNRISLLRGAQKATSIKPTKRTKQGVLAREGSRRLTDAASCQGSEFLPINSVSKENRVLFSLVDSSGNVDTAPGESRTRRRKLTGPANSPAGPADLQSLRLPDFDRKLKPLFGSGCGTASRSARPDSPDQKARGPDRPARGPCRRRRRRQLPRSC